MDGRMRRLPRNAYTHVYIHTQQQQVACVCLRTPPTPGAALAAAGAACVLCLLRRRRAGAAPDTEAPAKPASDLGSKCVDSLDAGEGGFVRQHALKLKRSAAGHGATDSAAGSPAGSGRIGAAAAPRSGGKTDLAHTDELLSWVSCVRRAVP